MDDPDISLTPPTVAELAFFAGGRHPKADLIGRCANGLIRYVSGRELVERVRDLGLGLTSLGMRRGDRVALVSESRPEWLLADFAILTSGAVTTPLYPTLSVGQVEFILRDSEASFVIVSNAALLEKIASAAEHVPSIRGLILMDEPIPPRIGTAIPIYTFADVAERGHRRILDSWGLARTFHDEAKQVRPSDLATLVYTSGTTGDPKGVMLTHGNLIANLKDIQIALSVSADDVALSFLPLCHAFERMVAYLYLVTGVSMIFAESIDTVARDLIAVRPTVMTGVPRVFEKLHARVLAKGREHHGPKRAIFDWAMRLAGARGARLPEGKSLSPWQRLTSRFADARVYQPIRDAVGGRMRYAVSGSAPLRQDVARAFYGIGLPILEGYGLTETSPVLTVNPLDAVRFGTVGKALPSVELRIAEDGEILARGPNVMAGYYKRPGETAEAIRDGWFHTGDIGSIDAAGYLRITDRKKELIVTSGGKKVAPQSIEGRLRAHPLIAEAVLIGEQRNFLTALLVPDMPEVCRRLGALLPADADAVDALVMRADVAALFQEAVDELNRDLAQFERVRKFTVLAREFTMDSGELTPTLKVKRRVIESKYRAVIDLMYSTGQTHS